jgi:hypothetical protein
MALKKMKIRLTEQNNFDVVSKALAEAGYENVVGDSRFLDATELYVYANGDILKTTKETSAGRYFEQHDNEEHFLTPAGFVKKDYYKQPVSTFNWSAIFSTTLPSKAEHDRQRKIAILEAMAAVLKKNEEVPSEWWEELKEKM